MSFVFLFMIIFYSFVVVLILHFPRHGARRVLDRSGSCELPVLLSFPFFLRPFCLIFPFFRIAI